MSANEDLIQGRNVVSGSGAIAREGSVAAGAGGVAVGRDVHGPVVVAGQGAQVTVTVRGENLRDKEMAYLAGLLKDYAYWRDHYTPLAGIAEVRAAVQDGPRLDLPMPFIPAGFEKLTEHGYGERAEVRRQPVDDLRAAVAEHRRIVLLGEPGSGKTTTLWRLAYDYAQAARDDGQAPLPVLVPLGGYTDSGPFDAYLARYLGPLAPYLETYRASERLILLLDGLNEMPQADYVQRVGRVRDVLERRSGETVVVTCRALDYVVKLERLQKLEVSPLDEARMRAFLHNYLGEAAGERLFWALTDDEVRALWETWQGAGGTWTEFWTADDMPEDVYGRTTPAQDRLWKRMRETPPPMLALCSNPYLLLMTAQVYAGAGGELPANRARLFAAFVDTLLGRERKRHATGWIDAGSQQDGLAALAYCMQVEGERGTTVDRAWALEQLAEAVPDEDAERLLHLAASATLLDAGETRVRFYHQLLQEYFAAREMGRRVAEGEPWDRYWPPERWWEPSGWEETAILLAGMQADASDLLDGLMAVNPAVAARCLLQGDAQVDAGTRRNIIAELAPCLAAADLPPVARVQAGENLARLGDPRDLDELATVPAGSFLMGSSDADEMASGDEKPQHELTLPAFKIGKYPVTNAQFVAFVAAGGYGERRFWTQDGWKWKEREGWTEPSDYGAPFNLPNHPVVGVSWYEALAFCAWLSETWRAEGVIAPDETVRLPTEAEWEKAARGGLSPDRGRQGGARRYPWGDDPDPNRANYSRTGIGSTSAVGCFPGGASPYGCLDMVGNVWEWTQSQNKEYPYDPLDGRENLEAGDRVSRVLRGGAFNHGEWYTRCALRFRNLPHFRNLNLGFRVLVAAPFPHPPLHSGTRHSDTLGLRPLRERSERQGKSRRRRVAGGDFGCLRGDYSPRSECRRGAA